MPDRVLIVGAGAAGVATAAGLRRHGYEGEVTLVSEEAVPPYDRPPLSKQVLSGAWDPEQASLLPPVRFESLRARWMLGGRAVALDPEARSIELDDGRSMDADAIVIATGVRPRELPGQPENVHMLRTLGDAIALRKELKEGVRLAVVGAGFLGLEVAATARGLGAEVHVFEPVASPLADRIGDLASSRLVQLHRENGVEVLADTPLAEIRPADQPGLPIRVSGPDIEVEVDVVLVAIGSLPNVEWLEGSGLALEDGVICDESLRAADGIWAAGDVARWRHSGLGGTVRFEHRMNANEHGSSLAAGILGEQNEPVCPVPFFWSDQYDVKIQLAGTIPPGAVGTVTWEEGQSFVEAFHVDGRLTGVLGWNAARQLVAHRAELAELIGSGSTKTN